MLGFVSLNGHLLVELFFIISGFLFFNSYYKKIIENKTTFSEFIKKRYLRLMPLAIITIIFMALGEWFYYLLENDFWLWSNNNIFDILIQSSGVQHALFGWYVSLNNSVWYISILILCYCLFYYLTKLVKKYKNNYFYLIPILLALLINFYHFNFPLFNATTARGYMAFSIGVILAIIMQQKNDKRYLFIVSILTLILIIIEYKIFGNAIFPDLSYLLTLIIYPSLLIILLNLDFLFRFINKKIITYIRNISFGIYLWNLPIQLFTLIIEKFFHLNFNYGSLKMIFYQILIHILVATISYYSLNKILTKTLEKIINFFQRCFKCEI